MEVIEKRKAWEEHDETQASRFIRCLLFLCFQAPFFFFLKSVGQLYFASSTWAA